MVGGLGCFGNFVRRSKPYIAIIGLQFGYAGATIFTKLSLNSGMSHYVLVVYRHAFATAAIAPFAILLDRKVRPKITFPIFLQLFVLGLLGPVIDQNFYYAGLKFTSPTFSCAMSNMLPAMTFLMAVLCRMEIIDIKKVGCIAKVVGTAVTVGGAMLMTFYKGNIINSIWSDHVHSPTPSTDQPSGSAETDWVKGSIFLIIATLAWAAFFILQAKTLKRYPAHLSLTAIVCFLGTLQSIGVTLVMEHKPSVWQIGWGMNLLTAAYSGIVASGIAYYVQGLVMRNRGPVFVTTFSPLMMIIVAIMASFILAENIYFGGVLGAILIVAGLYAVIWGKYKEHKEIEDETICESIKGNEEDDIEMQRKKGDNVNTLAVSVHSSEATMIVKEAPKA